MLCFFANPKIYIFPRKKSLIFPSIFKDEVETTPLAIKNILTSYEDSKNFNFKINDVGFKNIEDNIYIDLAEEIDDNKLRVTRCISIGFLKKKDDNYFYNNNFNGNLDVEVACEISDSHYTCYLENIIHHGIKITNKSNPSEPLIIHPGYDGNTSLEDIYIIIEIDKNHINSTKLTIKARHKGESKWKYTSEFNIYRNTQKKLDDFRQSSSNKDSDFFVLPRVNPGKNQKNCIKQLQIINNQVFARNASLIDFEFVDESGEIEKTVPVPSDNSKTKILHIDESMEKNARNSLTAFQYDSETDTGCKSGNKIEKLETHYSYNFSNYGQQKDIIEYLQNEYFVSNETLKGRIYDRNFLFGNYKDGEPDNKIEGIVNLYTKVVVIFIDNLTEQIDLFHEFNHAWLSCPYYNTNYKRGPLTVQDGMNKYLYSGSGDNKIIYSLSNIQNLTNPPENNILPSGWVINFKIGKDEFAFEKEAEKFYEIESVKIQNTIYSVENGIFIKLSLADKKKCDDRTNAPYNMGNYNGTSYNYGNYGIPYYINTSDMKRWGNDKPKMSKSQLLSWNEQTDNNGQIKNWYSYNAKPNTEDFGIDCSGFVINAITGISSDKNHYFSTSDLDIRALSFGKTYCRKLPISENFGSNTFLTKNDIVYTSAHIAFCFEGQIYSNFNITYISKTQISENNRNFIICHNYGIDYIWDPNYIPVFKNGDLYSRKTLQGRFRHWGAKIKSNTPNDNDGGGIANLGRFYLWK